MLLQNLCTERLRFRRFHAEDQTDLSNFFEDQKATQFFTVLKNPAYHALARIEAQIRRYEKEGDGLCAIVDRQSGALIGQVGLLWMEVDGIRELEIGYHLQPKCWGKGYATEAAMACRDFAFQQHIAPSIISIINPRNKNSIKVAERNGMTLDKETMYKGGPVLIYRIERTLWAKNNC